jgi:hypothetical protein
LQSNAAGATSVMVATDNIKNHDVPVEIAITDQLLADKTILNFIFQISQITLKINKAIFAWTTSTTNQNFN